MPEESKKGHDKKKHDPKDQRRPRQRHQQAASEKKADKKPEEPKITPKVTVPQKTVYESPPPEFFKSLKRETDEILKITEEENAKYKKKEIQSNWTKYEMPIESYEEIEEQENMGADYEKLIQAPLSIGGHFQFKHEKSWDVNTGPSQYDKYFDINMEDLNIALCTIPFYERNSIEQSLFTEGDILNMKNKTTRYKQKYYNDKSYATPETEAQDKILSSLCEKEKNESNSNKDEDTNDIVIDNKVDKNEAMASKEVNLNSMEHIHELQAKSDEIVKPKTGLPITEIVPDKEVIEQMVTEHVDNTKESTPISNPGPANIETKHPEIVNEVVEESKTDNKAIEFIESDDFIFRKPHKTTMGNTGISESPEIKLPSISKVEPPMEPKKPVIESPEDLEKWLDDFLDG